jgi:hypothetical protein
VETNNNSQPNKTMAIFTQSAFKAKIAKLETTLTSLGGKPPVHKHPPFTQTGWKDRITQLESLISARRNPQSLLPQNMAMDKALAIMEKVQREKPAGKTPMLDALAKAYLDDEKAKDARNAAQRPAPAKATSAAPVRPAAPAAPAAVMPSAASIASALLDQQEARAAAAKIKTREQFTAMSPRDQMAFCKAGGKIVN